MKRKVLGEETERMKESLTDRVSKRKKKGDREGGNKGEKKGEEDRTATSEDEAEERGLCGVDKGSLKNKQTHARRRTGGDH